MITNLYETVKADPANYKQLTCKALLLTEYNGQQQGFKQGQYSTSNYIMFVLKGKRTILQPGEKYVMDEGKCIFAKKGGWVTDKDAEGDFRALVFFIPDEYIKHFARDHRTSILIRETEAPVPAGQMIPVEVNGKSKECLMNLLPCLENEQTVGENFLEDKLRELLFDICADPANAGLFTWFCHVADSKRLPLADVMEANFTYNLSLADYSRIAGRSIATFKREFAVIYNTTPGKWLIQKRLDYAGILLNGTSKPVNEIAVEAGFENTTHFNRVFKEKYGLPPLQYRFRIKN